MQLAKYVVLFVIALPGAVFSQWEAGAGAGISFRSQDMAGL